MRLADFDTDSMLDMFTYEMSRLLDELEQNVIKAETGFTLDAVNEIFRIMHTIKGSAAMMKFDNISTVAHSVEDLFYFLREEKPEGIDYSRLTDHVLEGMDFIKVELAKLEMGEKPNGDGTGIIQTVKGFLAELKGGGGAAAPPPTAGQSGAASGPQTLPPIASSEANGQAYRGKIWFEHGCEMENIRAYTFLHNIEDRISNLSHIPADVIDESSAEIIQKNGFQFQFTSKLSLDELDDIIGGTIYLKKMEFDAVNDEKSAGSAKDIPGKKYNVKVYFDPASEMENVRAYTLIHNIEETVKVVSHVPTNIIEESSAETIRKDGFSVVISTDMPYADLEKMLQKTLYLKSLEINEEAESKTGDDVVTPEQAPVVVQDKPAPVQAQAEPAQKPAASAPAPAAPAAAAPAAASPAASAAKSGGTIPQHVISVNVGKLDLLLNLMGELVIAEAMVTQNPELDGLELESFVKEARQLHKIINDIQDIVMSMRMIPLQSTFFKMHRIVRDMCRQLNKEVDLIIIGEETEVDKNIIEHISDPLMHIIRNAIDHGIEMPEERKKAEKPEKGKVILEAKNTGGDVLIIVKDDGFGLNRERILAKAKNSGLLRRDESEYSDKEINQFIFLPGFSTNDQVTSYSGRGVGMDVVSTNLEVVGGSVTVESVPGDGSTFTMKIPLTLAIIEGMTIRMGGAKYTIPIISMVKSFKASEKDIFKDPSGNEMITERGEVYNVVRLYEFFGVESEITQVEDGIMIMLENGEQTVCLFVDDLIGEQQVVVKSMPKYIKKIRGISGCTLLGNGDISLIIDVGGFFDK